MAVLVDSNILLRSMQPTHPHSALAENATAALRLGNETLMRSAWPPHGRERSLQRLGLLINLNVALINDGITRQWDAGLISRQARQDAKKTIS
jgi:hypothetical protein